MRLRFSNYPKTVTIFKGCARRLVSERPIEALCSEIDTDRGVLTHLTNRALNGKRYFGIDENVRLLEEFLREPRPANSRQEAHDLSDLNEIPPETRSV